MADERERRQILARRARFVAAALASAGLVASTPSCAGDTEKDKSNKDASASGGTGGTPQPCLSAPFSGGTGGTISSGGAGGTPRPCLEPPLEGGTGGVIDAGPGDADSNG